MIGAATRFNKTPRNSDGQLVMPAAIEKKLPDSGRRLSTDTLMARVQIMAWTWSTTYYSILFRKQLQDKRKSSVRCLVHCATRTAHRLDGSSNVATTPIRFVFWLWVVCFRLFLLQLFHCCNRPRSPGITRSSAFTQSALSYFRGGWRCPA